MKTEETTTIHPTKALMEYAEGVASHFDGHDIFYREDGEEAIILAHVEGKPTTVVSVMLPPEGSGQPQVAEIPEYGWRAWQSFCDSICAESRCTACHP